MSHSQFTVKSQESTDDQEEVLDRLNDADEILVGIECLHKIYTALPSLVGKNKIYFFNQQSIQQEMMDFQKSLNSEREKLETIKKDITHYKAQNDQPQLVLISKSIENHVLSFDDLSATLFKLKKKIHDLIAPRIISADHPVYKQPIKKVCFRGEGRPPITKNGKGVFQVGCSKEIFDQHYAYIAARKINTLKRDKIIEPYVSNTTNTIGVSKFLESAVLFPLEFVDFTQLKVDQLIRACQNAINELAQETENDPNVGNPIKRLEVDSFLKSELAKMKKSERATWLKEMVEKNIPFNDGNDYESFEYFLRDTLASQHNDNKVATLIMNRLKRNLSRMLPRKNKAWVYAVYIEQGCDVTSHGFRTHLNEKRYESSATKNEHLIFAFEICTDEIPPEHVIAAFEVDRNFEKFKIVGTAKFAGEGYFILKNIQYNPAALKYFTDKGIDVEPYKKMLEKYMAETQTANGRQIHTMEHGIRRNKI